MYIVLFLLCLVLSNGEIQNGLCGESLEECGFTFDTDSHVLTLSGNGKSKDFTSEDQPWISFNSQIEHIVVEEGITSIGNYLFSSLKNVKVVELPKSLNSIGISSFSEMESLEGFSINLENELFSSEDGVFYSKEKKKLIQYPNGKKAALFEIPETVENIEIGSFEHPLHLSALVIPQSVGSIPENTLSQVTSLKTIIEELNNKQNIDNFKLTERNMIEKKEFKNKILLSF